MIAYDCDIDGLKAAVGVLDSTWLAKAKKREKAIQEKKKFQESSSIWSDIKPVFIELQHRKCVFCERQFESQEYGRIEHDLEHFRPKSSVKSWPPQDWPTKYQTPMGESSKHGYYWLAYNLENYAAACKVCNSPLKADYFPIGGRRAKTKRSYSPLREKPYLCYPIGKNDADPETLITFMATTAVPVATSGHERARGEVIIDFFKLNDRLQLHRERARMISLLGSALKSLEAGIDVAINTQVVSQLDGAHIPHAGCLRAFRRSWTSDKPLAARVHNACQLYAVGIEDAKPPQP